MKKLLLSLTMLLWLLSPKVYATDQQDDVDHKALIEEQKNKIIDFDTIQGTMEQLEIEQENKPINFRQLIGKIMEGDYEFSLLSLLGWGLETVFKEVFLNIDLMVQVIIITIIIAIFSNFTSAFSSKYIGEVGFFVTYLILSAIIIQTFQMISNVSSGTISNATTFMQALVPSFFASVSLSGNFNSVWIFYESTLMIMSLIDWIILKIILPIINLIVILEIANNITEESLISKLTELFKGGVSWGLKTILMLFFGLNLLQSFTLPMVDTVTNKSIKNAMEVIPVIGSTLDGVTDTVLGSTMLIKNAIGVGGVIVVLTICFIPLLKIIAFILIYKGVAAIVQPIANNRIVECLSGVGDIAKLLLGAVFTVVLLFIISIAIVSLTTNLTYIAG